MMEEKRLKIAFAGPSGLGKTTLANLIAERIKVYHPSTSAGDIFTDRDKSYLFENFGYTGEGHRNVINLSSTSPDFGTEFQRLLLLRRVSQIQGHNRIVLDRSPIDNMVYMLTQVAHNIPEDVIKRHLNKAQAAYHELTHLIIIRYSSDIPFIEDNQSRVPNRYFQQYISDVFGGVYTRYFSQIIGPRVIEIDFWDLQERIKTVLDFVQDPRQLNIDYEAN